MDATVWCLPARGGERERELPFGVVSQLFGDSLCQRGDSGPSLFDDLYRSVKAVASLPVGR